MSGGPTFVGREDCMAAIQKDYINVSFSKDDWCKYKKECKVDYIVNSSCEVCLLCKYRKQLNIPKILDNIQRSKHNGS